MQVNCSWSAYDTYLTDKCLYMYTHIHTHTHTHTHTHRTILHCLVPAGSKNGSWSNCIYASDIWAGEQAKQLQLSAICKLRYSGYRSFVILHLMLLSPFRDWFWRKEWDYGLAIRLSPLLLLRRYTDIRVKHCLIKEGWFRALCMRLSFALLTYCMHPKIFAFRWK